MSDPSTGGPSEEELRAYLESLRAAQPVEVIVQAFGVLATAAEVKLGMDDARILIDGMGGLIEAVGQRLPETIVERMTSTVSQLQMAQVQAERQAGQSETGQDAEAVTAPPADGDPQPAGRADPAARPGAPAQESTASRLWIPGRD